MSNLSVNIGPVSRIVLVPYGVVQTAARGRVINLTFGRGIFHERFNSGYSSHRFSHPGHNRSVWEQRLGINDTFRGRIEMANNSLRVVVWATGGIGSIAIRAIQRRPDIELVGVWVHSEEKVGKDAGEVANGEPIGLAATNDADALIGLKPDCVIYAASGPERDALAIPDYVKLLEAGINVVTTSTTRLVNPHTYEPAEWRDQLAAAAKQGQASLYASGIEPGFAADYLPLVLSTQSSSIEKIHAFEIGLYDDYGVPDIMSDALGFGQPLDYQPWISFPGAIAGEWQGQIRLVADALGVEVQEVRETFDRAVTNRTLEVAMGTVDAGTCGALRMQAIGVVDGREAIVIEHVTRLAHDVAPDWPTGIGDLSYRVAITGDPDIDCTLAATLKDPRRAGVAGMTSGAGAMVATAMRVLNAVPYVVAAEPGLLSSVDLPLTIPRNAFVTR
jgi:2,4-diaminopentanoate dehydrogenase